MPIKDDIKAAMERKRFTAADLAREARVTPSWLSRWLNDPTRNAREDVIDRILDALKLRIR